MKKIDAGLIALTLVLVGIVILAGCTLDLKTVDGNGVARGITYTEQQK